MPAIAVISAQILELAEVKISTVARALKTQHESGKNETFKNRLTGEIWFNRFYIDGELWAQRSLYIDLKHHQKSVARGLFRRARKTSKNRPLENPTRLDNFAKAPFFLARVKNRPILHTFEKVLLKNLRIPIYPRTSWDLGQALPKSEISLFKKWKFLKQCPLPKIPQMPPKNPILTKKDHEGLG